MTTPMTQIPYSSLSAETKLASLRQFVKQESLGVTDRSKKGLLGKIRASYVARQEQEQEQAPVAVVAPVAVPAPAPKKTRVPTVKTLKEECRRRGLKVSGKKAELIERLENDAFADLLEEHERGWERQEESDSDWDSTPPTSPRDEGATPLKVASLFCGVGGLDMAFHNDSKYEVVFANDMDKYACATYERNHGLKPVCCKVEDVETIPDYDILIGGFPCQGFSMAKGGARNPEDTRNLLYLQLVKQLEERQPKYFVFENVLGLTRGKMKPIFEAIKRELRGCGYRLEVEVVRMEKHGLGQSRHRVIFAGVRSDLLGDMQFPVEGEITTTMRDVIGDMPRDVGSGDLCTKGKIPVSFKFKCGNVVRSWDKPCYTINTTNPHPHPDAHRRLSVRECARLQSFPDDFVFTGSMTQQYKQIGNAVPPLLSGLVANMISAVEDTMPSPSLQSATD